MKLNKTRKKEMKNLPYTHYIHQHWGGGGPTRKWRERQNELQISTDGCMLYDKTPHNVGKLKRTKFNKSCLYSLDLFSIRTT